MPTAAIAAIVRPAFRTIASPRCGSRDTSANMELEIVYTPWLSNVTIWKLMKNTALADGPCALMIRTGNTSCGVM